eukprot:GEMP01070097.1.p1 GENE.GEMP01070097.1~~GEMP01070097.1.p1  ORF type:complete len:218 (+),score=32.81 GEMP01070097.1:198-851(+)
MNTDQAGSLSAQNSCHGLLFADEAGDEILESGAVPLTRQSTRKSNTTGAMTRNAAGARGLPRCPARYDIGKKPGRERLDNMAMSATEQNQDTFSVKSEEVTAEEFLETTYKRLSKLESDRLRCLSEVRQERIMAERAQLKNPEISRKSKQLSSAWGDRAPVYLRADHECAMKDWRLRRKVEEKRNVEMAQLRDKPSILARSRYNNRLHMLRGEKKRN